MITLPVILQYSIAAAISYSVGWLIKDKGITTELSQYLYPISAMISIYLSSIFDRIENNKKLNEVDKRYKETCELLAISESEKVIKLVCDAQEKNNQALQDAVTEAISALTPKEAKITALSIRLEAMSARNSEMVIELEEKADLIKHLTENIMTYNSTACESLGHLREISATFQKEILLLGNSNLTEELLKVHDKLQEIITSTNQIYDVLSSSMLEHSLTQNRKRTVHHAAMNSYGEDSMTIFNVDMSDSEIRYENKKK